MTFASSCKRSNFGSVISQDTLKARQKNVKDAEAAIAMAGEARAKAESKLAAAKAEHEKALKRAKAAGIVPDLPNPSAADNKQ